MTTEPAAPSSPAPRLRQRLGVLHQWFVTPPANLSLDQLDFYALSNYTHALGLLSHLFFLGFFLVLRVDILVAFNVLSIVVFVVTLTLSMKGKLDLALLLGGLEVGGHQALAVFALGLGPAFQHYILILIIGTLYYRHLPMRVRLGMAVMPLLWYIAVHVYGLHYRPWYDISPLAIDLFAAMNVTFFVVILMGMCLYFQVYVERARILAERLAQSKTLFLANMSHELRTPLNAILGFAQILQRSNALNEQDRRNLSTINRSGEHLLDLINDILDMSKVEEGKLTLQRATFDLPRLLRDLQGMFALAARRKNLTLRFELDPDLPRFVRTDELRLRQVLINLVGNALKFTTRGEVSVSARQTSPGASRVAFRVSDTGAGIRAEELGELFQLFVQAEAGRKSRRGTGLGLALSQRFVQLLGGQITVESEVGRGSAFAFAIPLEVDATADVNSRLAERRIIGMKTDGKPHRMLVVDDNPENRDVLVQLLSGLGFEVTSANDGAEGVTAWERSSPELIWMDLRMPVMDGHEACRVIREKAASAGRAFPPIIAISASSMDGGREGGKDVGFASYVGKPFREGELYEVMERHLPIRFEYAEAFSVPAAPDAEASDGETVAIQLARVDPALVRALGATAMVADFDGARSAIEQIRPAHPALAARLLEFLEEYRFDTLQELVAEKEAGK